MPKEIKLILLVAVVAYGLIWLNYQGYLPGTQA